MTNQYDKRTHQLRRRRPGPARPPDPWAAHGLSRDYETEDKTENLERLLPLIPILSRHLQAHPDRISQSSNATPDTVRAAAVKRFITAPPTTRKEDGAYGLERIQTEQNHPPSLDLREVTQRMAAAYAAADRAAGKPEATPTSLT